MMEYITRSEQETATVASSIAQSLAGGDIVLLAGELGAGKTTFVKGIAEALGATEQVSSPTFSLMNMYPLATPVRQIVRIIHVDTYRMEQVEDMEDIGLEEYLADPQTLCIIEWPEKITPLVKNYHPLSITITHKEKNRVIQVAS